MKRLRRLVPIAMAAALAFTAVSCGTREYESPGASSDSGYSESETQSEPEGQRGEIWQWALGRDVDDPALRPYTLDMRGDAASVQSEGFQLHFDSAMKVYMVALVNDESSLGFGPENTFSAYQGALPGDLSWDMTAANVVEVLGEPDDSYTTGYGVELSFTYRDLGGYAVEIDLAARHQRDLWDSPMHMIKVGSA
ncbi:hypothetical protein [Actinoplanes sp. NPDC049599]|uniref:hypothetical protein n=1 Tax=Actinoplanes sp. NPDC049599 TaxID=3363903 RepID=UPI00379CD684